MREIPLTQGRFAQVDDEDYEWLSQFKWCTTGTSQNVIYAYRRANKKNLRMHRIILSVPDGYETDHIDGNGLNNQKNNLRICSHAENGRNIKKHIDNSSGFKGVDYRKDKKKWRARIRHNKVDYALGNFETKEEAAIAYNMAAIGLHGEFAKLNTFDRKYLC